MSPILFFIIFFISSGMGKIFLQINSAAVAFIDILTVVYPPSGLMSAFPLFPAKKRRFVLYDFGTP